MKANLEIHGNTSLHLQNEAATVLIFGAAVAFLFGKAKGVKKSQSATIIKVPAPKWDVDGWLEREGIKPERKQVIIYKRVSKDFKTQENTVNETAWLIGTEVEHPKWSPEHQECGEGKFHACGRPYFCDEFRSNIGDRYIAIQVEVKNLYAWDKPSYPHKIAFRKGKVLFECNRFGDKL